MFYIEQFRNLENGAHPPRATADFSCDAASLSATMREISGRRDSPGPNCCTAPLDKYGHFTTIRPVSEFYVPFGLKKLIGLFDCFRATRRIRTDDLLITNSHSEHSSSTQQHKAAERTGNSKS
jgi:hypothetical protein